MLDKLLIWVLNMSIISSYVIVFVLIARLLLKKTPKIFSYSLWGIVLIRLLCPFSFESVLSLMPMAKTPIPQDIIYSTAPQINTGMAALDSVVNPILPVPSNIGGSVNPIQIWLFIGTVIWVLGMVTMVIYSIVAFIKLKQCLIGAAQFKENVHLADHISSPFVMGLFKPKIYLPSLLSDSEKNFITLHEMCHVRRFDHVTRILGFAALTIHWFNPLVWIAFIISGKDMEMSCDEAVMKKMDTDIRTEYSQSLLRFGTAKRMINATPLAFGEGDTKNRVKNVLNYKKPAFWVILISVISVVAIGVGLMANPKQARSFVMSGTNLSDLQPEKILQHIAEITMVDVAALEMTADNFGLTVSSDFSWADSEAIRFVFPNKQNAPQSAPPSENFEAIGLDPSYVGKDIYISPDGDTLYLDSIAGEKTLQFVFEEAKTDITEPVSAEYTMMKLGKNGKVLSSYSLKSKELADAILFDALSKSAAWEGVDVSTLEECYLIRQSFTETGEIHDYYAYRFADGTSVLQGGTDGRYSTLSSDLYLQLVDSFKSNDYLFFWVKPDEPPQYIGDTAANVWLKSFINEQTPAESRISDYEITDVTVIAGEPKKGAKWEDMAYQYVVQVTYNITTATEQYLAAADGISGKGSFQGLFRELCVKVNVGDGGGFQIVGVGTGGGEHEFLRE